MNYLEIWKENMFKKLKKKKVGLLIGQETTGTSQFLPGADEELAGYKIILNHDQQDKQVYNFSIDMLLWKHPSRQIEKAAGITNLKVKERSVLETDLRVKITKN